MPDRSPEVLAIDAEYARRTASKLLGTKDRKAIQSWLNECRDGKPANRLPGDPIYYQQVRDALNAEMASRRQKRAA